MNGSVIEQHIKDLRIRAKIVAKPQRALVTHNSECWKYGQHHYECALRKIVHQQVTISALTNQLTSSIYDVPEVTNKGNH